MHQNSDYLHFLLKYFNGPQLVLWEREPTPTCGSPSLVQDTRVLSFAGAQPHSAPAASTLLHARFWKTRNVTWDGSGAHDTNWICFLRTSAANTGPVELHEFIGHLRVTLDIAFQEHGPSVTFNLIISSTVWCLFGFTDLKQAFETILVKTLIINYCDWFTDIENIQNLSIFLRTLVTCLNIFCLVSSSVLS